MEERLGLVQRVEVRHGGEVHRADYFVEHNIIHAQIGERTLLTPVNNCPASDTVKVLLAGHLMQQDRKMGQVRRWHA